MADAEKTDSSKAPVSGTTGDADTGDTIDMESEPIMETAELKALVELEAELFDDGKSPDDIIDPE